MPAALYRVKLGRLLGNRFVVLVHRGRVSARPREVVLEVVEFSRGDAPRVVVVAGWGERSQWYRNVRAAPPIALKIGGSEWRHPECRFPEPAEAAEVIARYRRRHPVVGRILERFLGWPRGLSQDERAARARELRLVAFSPSGSAREPLPTTGVGEPRAPG